MSNIEQSKNGGDNERLPKKTLLSRLITGGDTGPGPSSLHSRYPLVLPLYLFFFFMGMYNKAVSDPINNSFSSLVMFLGFAWIGCWVMLRKTDPEANARRWAEVKQQAILAAEDARIDEEVKAVKNASSQRRIAYYGKPVWARLRSTRELFTILKRTGLGEEGFTESGGQEVWVKSDHRGISFWRYQEDPLPFLKVKWHKTKDLKMTGERLLVEFRVGSVIPLMIDDADEVDSLVSHSRRFFLK